ncbi:hypothetical protein TWF718_002476 [Orbilia javanica]|uniref:Uncharacterized protein n=1 Tax=Orbilia javanica TaxID=47235 RepID=A0AAN8MRC1_9PEZI
MKANPPFPFKMGVFKRKEDVPDWAACAVNIFDCAEDPLPLEHDQISGHIELRRFCSNALGHIYSSISELNEANELRELGYKWIIRSVHIDWEDDPNTQFIVVFELRNARAAFDAVFGAHSFDNLRISDAPGGFTPTDSSEASGFLRKVVFDSDSD